MPRVPTRLSHLSLVCALAGLASACTMQAVPPLARTTGLEALTGQRPVTMLIIIATVVALLLAIGVFALLRRRRSAGDPSAAWSVLADVPDRDAASFSLPPVVEAPQPQDGTSDDAVSDEHVFGDDDDTTTFWLDQPPEPASEADDTLPPRLPSAAERMAGMPEKPWWIDDDSDLGAEPVDDRDDPAEEPVDDPDAPAEELLHDPDAHAEELLDDPDDLGAELLDDAGRWADRAAPRNAMFGPPSGT